MNAAAQLLVGPAVLARELAGGAPPLVIDARWQLGGPPGAGRYRAGHLPGAVFVDLDEDLSGPPGAGGRHPLPEAAAFQAAMRRAGLSAGRPVVVYDDGDSVAAARAWWTLRYFGHDQVRVLDGGFAAWTAAGLPADTVVPDVPPGDFTATAGGMPLIDADGAAALARAGVLLDVRSPERYRGEAEPVDPVAGHIPGALSAPVTGSSTAGGRFQPPGRAGRAVRRTRRQCRAAAAGRVLRLGCHRRPRGARARAGRPARRPLRRLLVRLDRRSRPPGRHRTGTRLSQRRRQVAPGSQHQPGRRAGGQGRAGRPGACRGPGRRARPGRGEHPQRQPARPPLRTLAARRAVAPGGRHRDPARPDRPLAGPCPPAPAGQATRRSHASRRPCGASASASPRPNRVRSCV